MNNIVRFVGSVTIALILVSIPGLAVASFAFEWHGFLKTLLLVATIVEDVWIMDIIYNRSEELYDKR